MGDMYVRGFRQLLKSIVFGGSVESCEKTHQAPIFFGLLSGSCFVGSKNISTIYRVIFECV